jgi:hypothetical protein
VAESASEPAPDRAGVPNPVLAWAQAAPVPVRVSGSLALVVLVFCLEAALFLAFVTGRFDTPVFAGLHLCVCAVTATLARRWVGRPGVAGDGREWVAVVLQLAAWSAVAGPFGSLAAGALLVPRRRRAESATGASAAEAAFQPELIRPELTRLEQLHGSLLDNRLRIARAHAIRPLLSVIIDGTQAEKLDALSLISKRFDPALAPVLKRALEDKDGSVRVLAATVTAHQHNVFTKRIGALQATARAAPEVTSHWYDLAQARFDYAESRLLEASQVETEVGHAVQHLERATALDPDNAATRTLLDAVRQSLAPCKQHRVTVPSFPLDGQERVTANGI